MCSKLSKGLYPAAANIHPNMNIGQCTSARPQHNCVVLCNTSYTHSVLTHNSPKPLERLSTVVSNQDYWASMLSWKDLKLHVDLKIRPGSRLLFDTWLACFATSVLL